MSINQQKATDEQVQDKATDDTDTIAAEHRFAQASGEVFDGELRGER